MIIENEKNHLIQQNILWKNKSNAKKDHENDCIKIEGSQTLDDLKIHVH